MGLPKKLSDDQVREIRWSSLSQKRAAVKYNVNSRTIGNIRRGVTYKHVPAPSADPSGRSSQICQEILRW